MNQEREEYPGMYHVGVFEGSICASLVLKSSVQEGFGEMDIAGNSHR